MKTILITGSTDGIGLETARKLVSEGHRVLLHGRTPAKVERVTGELSALQQGDVESYVADLSSLSAVEGLARSVSENHQKLDVLINNAGVYRVPKVESPEGLDVRFVVNTIAPYLLTRQLLPLLGEAGRVVNLSSAAQAALEPQVLGTVNQAPDGNVYAQSKLALTMWTRELADRLPKGPVVLAVNPGSMLASKMVKEAYGVVGADLQIGAGILARAALSEEFGRASGQYFDNDSRRFVAPHRYALDAEKCRELVQAIEAVLTSTPRG